MTCQIGTRISEAWLDRLVAIGGASPAECEDRAARAMAIPADLAIVELGVYTGQGVCCYGLGSRFGKGAHVWGIDLWGLLPSGQEAKYDDPDNLRLAVDSLHECGLTGIVTQSVTLVRAHTHEAAKLWSRPIGLLAIDAGHQPHEVATDFTLWSPFVAAHGHLLMHDARNDGWPGVDACIRDLILPSGEWEEDGFVEPFSQWFRKR